MEVYRQPLYYEIAFSFMDVKEQIDSFERIAKRFSKVKMERFLDIACGPSLQLREIARRGYEAVGLDTSVEMLRYLEKRAKEERLKIETVKADMTDFKLEKKADFAFIMMGSLTVESNEKLLQHLDSLAASLKKGGLYLIQNMSVDWTRSEKQTWTINKNEIAVTTTFESHFTDIINQICTDELTLEVDDHGKKKRFVHKRSLKHIFPQEFKALVKLDGKFEFLGWWQGNESTWWLDKPLEQTTNPSNINMVLLRKK